jgi:hypothetical protein
VLLVLPSRTFSRWGLNSSSLQLPLEVMESIYAVFVGIVISEDCQLFRLTIIEVRSVSRWRPHGFYQVGSHRSLSLPHHRTVSASGIFEKGIMCFPSSINAYYQSEILALVLQNPHSKLLEYLASDGVIKIGIPDVL